MCVFVYNFFSVDPSVDLYLKSKCNINVSLLLVFFYFAVLLPLPMVMLLIIIVVIAAAAIASFEEEYDHTFRIHSFHMFDFGFVSYRIISVSLNLVDKCEFLSKYL